MPASVAYFREKHFLLLIGYGIYPRKPMERSESP